MADNDLRPFQISIPDSVLKDLRQRLLSARLPDEPPLDPWSTGTSVTYLTQLLDYWRDGFDWSAQEAKLNAFRQLPFRLPGLTYTSSMRRARALTRKAALSMTAFAGVLAGCLKWQIRCHRHPPALR